MGRRAAAQEDGRQGRAGARSGGAGRGEWTAREQCGRLTGIRHDWEPGFQGEEDGSTTIWGEVDKWLIEALRHTYPGMEWAIDELKKEKGRKLIIRVDWHGVVTAETADRQPRWMVHGSDLSHREVMEENDREAGNGRDWMGEYLKRGEREDGRYGGTGAAKAFASVNGGESRVAVSGQGKTEIKGVGTVKGEEE